MLYIRTLMLFALLAAIAGCSEASLGEEWFKIEDPVARNQFVIELEEQGIPFRVDKEGRVWFAAKQQAEVHEIAFHVMKSGEPDRETFAFTDPKYTDMLITRLHAEDVPFGIEKRQGITYVVLDSLHRPLWLPIKEEVGKLFVQEKTGQVDVAR